MFPLLRKNVFFLISRSSFSSSSSQLLKPLSPIQLRHFSSPPKFRSNCSCNVPVIVWWDFDNCRLPSGVGFLRVAPSIMAAVRANGIKGQIQIGAFGHFPSSKVDRDALKLTGISRHPVVSSSGENNDDAYKALLTDLKFWVSKNPPPAHLFLILGDRDDRDLSGILHRLRMKNYDILIACSGRASDTLCSAATLMWQWLSMLEGEDVIGKRFNYPPDAPFNLFYGTFWKSSAMFGDFAHQDVIHSRKSELFEDSNSSDVDKTSTCIHFEDPKSSELHQDVSHSEKPKLFSINSFWKDVESFVFMQPHCKRVQEENIRVSVRWNINDCRVPPGVSVLKVAPLILAAVRANGIKGPIDIVAYGDVTQYSKLERKALSSAGVHFRHFTGGKDKANRHLTYDLLIWTFRNPPPVHIFLISSDESLLQPLRMKNYNMLVAHPGRASYVMRSAATIIWPWSLILKGENLTGKYFNYPPDGPLHSWYGNGNLKVPI